MAVILVVDDDAMTLKLVERTLEGGGHEVVLTANPDEAAHMAASHQVDAVILDVMMPGRSGFDVFRDLHGISETSSTPVLFLSSLGETEDRIKGLKVGADEYLGKPFDPEELLLRLNRMIDGRVSSRAEFQGSLETLCFSDVIQSLFHGAACGIVEVGDVDRRGHIDIRNGQIVAASWGRLEGMEAILAMIDLHSGTFRFKRSGSDRHSSGSTIPIQKVMFAAAWLVDQVSRWPEIDAEARLRAGRDRTALADRPEAWEAVPLEEALDLIAEHPGISLAGLSDTGPWAPKRISLAVRYLVHQGLVEISGDEADDGGDHGERNDVDRAVDAAVQAVQEHGFSPRLPHFLILIDPTALGDFLEIRQSLPSKNLAVSGDGLTQAWSTGRIGNLAIRGSGRGVVLHVVPMNVPVGMKQTRSRLANYPAILVWIRDPERVDEIRWLIEWVETAPTRQWGVVCTADPAVSNAVDGLIADKDRWRSVSSRFDGIEDLLRTFAESS